MNRKYTKEKYLEIINYAKEKMPDISITSDIIVGFPGETYEDFCETLELIKAVGFSSLFTFIYSKRPGTPAAKMDDPVPEKEKSAWFQELLKVQEGMSAAFCAKTSPCRAVGTGILVQMGSAMIGTSLVFLRTRMMQE